MSVEHDALAVELSQLVEAARDNIDRPDISDIANRVGEIVTARPDLSMRPPEEQ